MSARFRDDGGVLAEAGDGGGERLGVAAGQGLVGLLRGEVDAGDAGLGQALQFVGLADAVLVQVAPEADVGVLGIIGVEQLVAVAIEASEGGEAVGGVQGAAGEGFGADDGIDAEEFAAGVDGAVAIAVEDDEGVIPLSQPVPVLMASASWSNRTPAATPTVSMPSPSRSMARGSRRTKLRARR
ncbi:MAG: hypothetical protein IPF74_10990 [Rhodocyclaceae bacterium]|nr:hypothetical protein [Rhodocyclaceae bacterium]